MSDSTSDQAGKWVRVYYKDDGSTLWEGLVYPNGRTAPDGAILYEVPLNNPELGRTVSIEWVKS